jgi:sulfur carrier protein
MKLIVNGQAHEVVIASLAELLAFLDYEGDWLATAVNGNVVPATKRVRFELNDGDRIEILAPMQGG